MGRREASLEEIKEEVGSIESDYGYEDDDLVEEFEKPKLF